LSTFDTVIVGAGAAGLAAAAELAAHGQSVCVLEARDRLGGRIFTRREPDLAVPIELGAEFIHGQSPATLGWLRRSNAAVVDAAHTRWRAERGKLQPADDTFEEMKRGLNRIRRPRTDLPFSEFLQNASGRKLAPRLRLFARALVEGFDAADATRVSTFETLDEWSGEGAADAPTFRPLNGYDALIGAISTALDPGRVTLQLNTVVGEVRWKRGEVIIDGTQRANPFSIRAPRAIITLPLGVLQLPPQASGSVRFSPGLGESKRTALIGLAAGPVVKVMLRFRKAFWEELDDGRYRDGAFFHSPNAAFPTFWTSLPVRSPLLAAWAAGPNATRLAGATKEVIVSRALQSLDSVFGKRAKLRDDLQGATLHDWQEDPFARGAYSYVTAGASTARKILATPLAGALFFAGEAADVSGESGTVAGALQSGVRAAREVLRSASRSASRR
jgi:monoamine oxidase